MFVGGGVTRPRIEEFIAQHRIHNVVMKPYQPREWLDELIALGDAHSSLVADGFEGLLLPSKGYGAMAAGYPTLDVGPSGGEVAQVIVDERCEICSTDDDGRALVRAIRELQFDPSVALAMGIAKPLGHTRMQRIEVFSFAIDAP